MRYGDSIERYLTLKRRMRYGTNYCRHNAVILAGVSWNRRRSSSSSCARKKRARPRRSSTMKSLCLKKRASARRWGICMGCRDRYQNFLTCIVCHPPSAWKLLGSHACAHACTAVPVLMKGSSCRDLAFLGKGLTQDCVQTFSRRASSAQLRLAWMWWASRRRFCCWGHSSEGWRPASARWSWRS